MKTVATSVLLLMGLLTSATHAAPPAPKVEKAAPPARIAAPLVVPKKSASPVQPSAKPLATGVDQPNAGQRSRTHEGWIEVHSVPW